MPSSKCFLFPFKVSAGDISHCLYFLAILYSDESTPQSAEEDRRSLGLEAGGRGQVHLPGPHPRPGRGTLHHLLIRNRQRLGV